MDEIIRVSDGLMIARGDLGIETPLEKLPILQKNIIRHCHWHNTPAIIATQMMASMVNLPHPTRAEVSDVANGIFDGADCLMLSEETAMGKYPVLVVEKMRKIIESTESYLSKDDLFENFFVD